MKVLCLWMPLEEPFNRGLCEEEIRVIIDHLSYQAFYLTSQIARGQDVLFLELSRSEEIRSKEKAFELLRESFRETLKSSLKSSQNKSFQSKFKSKKQKPQIFWGWGKDIYSAKVSAKFLRGENKKNWLQNDEALWSLCPLEVLYDYKDPFFVEKDPSLEKMISLLKKMGLRHLRDFMDIDLKALPSRFGKNALVIRDRIEGSSSLWPRFTFKKRVKEKILFEENFFMGLEQLLFICKKKLDKICKKVRSQGAKIEKIFFKIRCKKAWDYIQEERIEIDLSFPQNHPKIIVLILREKLQKAFKKNDLGGELVDAVFEVLEVSEIGFSQKSLFSRKEELQEKWESIYLRLQERLGQNSVFQASFCENYIPEKSWFRSSGVSEARGLAQIPERPLRVFSRPIPLRFQKGSFIDERSGRSFLVERLEELEKIEVQWWNKEKSRIYFKVKIKGEGWFWIFQDPQRGSFFWHGVFD
jgi:hypothetical protein